MQDPEDSAALFSLLSEIGVIAQRTRALVEARLPDGLTAPQFCVLDHLVRVSDGCSPDELSRVFPGPTASMSDALAGLEQRGLITMRPGRSDGVSGQVWLTDAARMLSDQLMRDMAAELARLSAGVDRDRLLEILPILAQLRALLDTDRDRAKGRAEDHKERIGPADFI